MKEQINVLSPLTWRWVGVNYDEVEIIENPPFPEVEIQVASGHDLRPVHPKLVEEWETRFSGMENGVGEKWLASHFAELSCGYFIDGSSAGEHPVYVTFSTRTGVLSDHNILYAREGETLRVILSYGGPTELHSGVTRIVAEQGSHVELVKIHREAASRQSVDIIAAKVAKGASVSILSVEAGGGHSLTNYQLDLEGEGAKGSIETVYLAQKEEVLDISYRINHIAKRTESSIIVNGVLKDRAKKTFKGVLDFQKGSSGSKGDETESAVLLDETVKNRAVPILLCTEDDVVGNHAANAGRLDDDAIFYMMSRGLSFEEAKRQLVIAKVAPTIEKIEAEEERKALFAYLTDSMVGGGQV